MNTRRFLVLFLVLSLSHVFAQSYKMHSVFVYSFTRYIQWPDSYNQGDFEIHVLGDSPILEELKALAKTKKVGDRVIKVTRIGGVAEIKKCNMLFIPASNSALLPEVITRLPFAVFGSQA